MAPSPKYHNSLFWFWLSLMVVIFGLLTGATWKDKDWSLDIKANFLEGIELNMDSND